MCVCIVLFIYLFIHLILVIYWFRYTHYYFQLFASLHTEVFVLHLDQHTVWCDLNLLGNTVDYLFGCSMFQYVTVFTLLLPTDKPPCHFYQMKTKPDTDHPSYK